MEFELAFWWGWVCWVIVVADKSPQRCGIVGRPKKFGEVVSPKKFGIVESPQGCGTVESSQKCGIVKNSSQDCLTRIRKGTAVFNIDKERHHSKTRKMKEVEAVIVVEEDFEGGKEWYVERSFWKSVHHSKIRSKISSDKAVIVNGTKDKIMDATKDVNKATDRFWQFKPP